MALRWFVLRKNIRGLALIVAGRRMRVEEEILAVVDVQRLMTHDIDLTGWRITRVYGKIEREYTLLVKGKNEMRISKESYDEIMSKINDLENKIINFNEKHYPAGSPKGGQFAPKGAGGSSSGQDTSSEGKKYEYDIPASILDAYATSSERYRDPERMQIEITDKGNLHLLYDGKDVATIDGSRYSEDTIESLREQGLFDEYTKKILAKDQQKTHSKGSESSKSKKSKRAAISVLDDIARDIMGGGIDDFAELGGDNSWKEKLVPAIQSGGLTKKQITRLMDDGKPQLSKDKKVIYYTRYEGSDSGFVLKTLSVEPGENADSRLKSVISEWKMRMEDE